MSSRLTYKFVKNSFEKEGYTLVSKEYINNKTKLEYICSKGHRHSITWNKWRLGKRCPYCYGNAKLTIQQVRQSFEKEGYILLSTKYINNKTKLDYICPNGHKNCISWDSWQHGNRCSICANNIKLTIKFIAREFEKEGYVLLSKEYVNNHTKLDYICPKGHKHYITWGNWKSGYRCPYCSGKAVINIEYIRDVMLKERYILLSSTYINAHIHLKVRCPKGHVYYVKWNNWKSGKRCPMCPSKRSKFEKSVVKFLDLINLVYITNDRTALINPVTNRKLELDIYFPTLNKAIECNGVYWHSKDVVVTRDCIKRSVCKKNNIDLLVITDIEWDNNRCSLEKRIKKFLGVADDC